MAVRSEQLAFKQGGFSTGGVDNVLYTVPSGRTTIMRTWLVGNLTGTTANVYLSIKKGSEYVELRRVVPLANATVTIISDWHVLDPGDQVVLVTNQAGVYTILSGPELEGN